MKKSDPKKLLDFLPLQIQNPKAIKGGNGDSGDNPDDTNIIGADDIFDG